MEVSKLDSAIGALGWRYDAERERFTDGTRRIDYRRILALVPGMSMDDLANYVNEKHEEWLAKQSPELAPQFEVVQSGEHSVIRLPAARAESGKDYLFWTGGTWRYNEALAMKFRDTETATAYIAKCAERMLVKSTFTASELQTATFTRRADTRQ